VCLKGKERVREKKIYTIFVVLVKNGMFIYCAINFKFFIFGSLLTLSFFQFASERIKMNKFFVEAQERSQKGENP
jgi:hypothetical protein